MPHEHDFVDALVPRRAFLSCASAALGAAALGGLPPGRTGLVAASPLTFPEFLKAAVPAARELVGDVSRRGEDRYLHTLAAFAARLVDVPVPKMRPTTEGAGPRHYLGENEAGDDAPFVVLHWRLDPGAKIGLHPHTYGNVVTFGLEGEAVVENYEAEGPADYARTTPFPVRRIHEQILRPGDVNLVPLSHGYVHGFVAGPAGARGLDITTRLRPKQPNVSLEVAARPLDAERRIFEGTWRFDRK